MKFYLSSFRIGKHPDKLKEMVRGNTKKIALIPNACDFIESEEDYKQSQKRNIDDLAFLDKQIEILDLRGYFGKENLLKKKLEEYGTLRVRGGNTFVLRQAMELSNFKTILDERGKQKNNTYAGYSAGAVVLCESLRAIELVDPADVFPYKEQKEQIREGLGYRKELIIPHYQSNHPESQDIEKVLEYCIKNNLPYQTLRDGDVIIRE